MHFSENSLWSQFEREGEEQVRLRLNRDVTSAQGLSDRYQAAEWLKMKAHSREQEVRMHSERQASFAEASVQLGKRQVNLAEDAIQLAKKADRHSIEANRLSMIAIGVGIASFIPALFALFR